MRLQNLHIGSLILIIPFSLTILNSEAQKIGDDRIVRSFNLPEDGTEMYQLESHYRDGNDIPRFIRFRGLEAQQLKGDSKSEKALNFLSEISANLHLANPGSELRGLEVKEMGDFGSQVKFQQYYEGLKIEHAFVNVHFGPDGSILGVNTSHIESPKNLDVSPSIDGETGIAMAKSWLKKTTRFYHLNEIQKNLLQYEGPSSELLISTNDAKAVLCYKITIRPNFGDLWVVYVDAQNGEIVNGQSLSCRIDGPRKSQKSIGLDNSEQEVGTYQVGDDYFLIDANKKMFDAASSTMPEQPKGVISVFDGHEFPWNDPQYISRFKSKDNRFGDNLQEKTAVSAMKHASTFYNELISPPFSTNSLDGKGMNINLLTNLNDDFIPTLGWDLASWNGSMVLLGNGDRIFQTPTSRGFDIVAHELTHGLIQFGPNIQAGDFEREALIEALCDIMACLLEGNWTIGEKSNLNPEFYPSGSLRNLKDPYNGLPNHGSWENNMRAGRTARHMSDFAYDKYARHYNSTIIGHAFYLITGSGAQGAGGMGREAASELFINAFNKLEPGAGFEEFRDALILLTEARWGLGTAYVKGIENAFEAVGIFPSVTEVDPGNLPELIGDNYLLAKKTSRQALAQFNLFDLKTRQIDTRINELSLQGSKASVTDDGKFLYIINSEGYVERIFLKNLSAEVDYLTQLGGGWSSVAISKDNKRLALGKLNSDTSIYVFDLQNGNYRKFRLYSNSSVYFQSTLYPLQAVKVDNMEWNYHGTKLLFDYICHYDLKNNEKRSLYNIGEMLVWDTMNNDFAGGWITNRYENFPAFMNLMNPTYAKRSTDLFVHDRFDKRTGVNTVMAINTQSEELKLSEVIQTAMPAAPSYSFDDRHLVLSDITDKGDTAVFIVRLEQDRMNRNLGIKPAVLVPNHKQAMWFTQGERALSVKEPISKSNQIQLYPNPVRDEIHIYGLNGSQFQYRIYTISGELIKEGPLYSQTIQLAEFEKGTYLISIFNESTVYQNRFILR